MAETEVALAEGRGEDRLLGSRDMEIVYRREGRRIRK